MIQRVSSMSKEGKFLIFCIEIYRSAKNLKGKEVMHLFQKYNVCVSTLWNVMVHCILPEKTILSTI